MTRRGWIAGLIGLLASQKVKAQIPDAGQSTMEAVRMKLRAAFPYPVTTVAGADALATWEGMRAAGKGWPVIIGGDEALDDICDQFSIDSPSLLNPAATDVALPSVQQFIAKSRAIMIPAGLAGWDGYEKDMQPASGPWPAHVGRVEPTIATDLSTGRPFAQVHIVTLPTERSWEVPAYLRWGNWNGCPPPEYHCAALRHWHERHGAELVGIDRDTINLRVERRPKGRVEALELARECYAYCQDTVDQGTGTIEALAATLMASDWWFFWWD